ncbi:MAG: lipase family protein [Oscillatoriales cyanobacterium SM2_2_1]|nr:lipase family protein [Oscillatoriales cyanobacterium SM2_2_1]
MTLNLEEAVNCCRLSAIAYAPELPTDVPHLGLRAWESRGTRALLSQDGTRQVLAFRGTESLVNWCQNLDFDLVQGFGGCLHVGFYEALTYIWSELRTNLNRDRPILLTGHSLGGALATIAALDLHQRDYRVTGVYTFGSPRVGNRAFAAGYDLALRSRTHRFVYGQDTVTRVPPRSFDYSHGGNFVGLRADGRFTEDPEDWKQFTEEVTGVNILIWALSRLYRRYSIRLKVKKLLSLSQGIKDHALGNYERALVLALKQSNHEASS